MALSAPLTGGCACGKIRYEASVAPLFGGLCCCRACQRSTGAAYNAVAGVPAPAFKITQGEPRFFETAADSGGTLKRAFCPDCGSPLFAQLAAAPIVSVCVGSIDDPSGFEPGAVVFAENKHPWVVLPEALPKFDKMPPR
ncbi:MAG TPA: GFA family protein [Polyangium sp.]|nr:GFA family protein [Polyangium sp.]